MVMRLSFSLDPELVDMIDQYAKERSVRREKAILELIEAGITHIREGGTIKIEQCRSFEEIDEVKGDIKMLIGAVTELQKEIRLIHHTFEKEWATESSPVPFQSNKWWRIWK
jgi:metal-responsive CopG/Arc/MetJ family transcriptional regulator